MCSFSPVSTFPFSIFTAEYQITMLYAQHNGEEKTTIMSELLQQISAILCRQEEIYIIYIDVHGNKDEEIENILEDYLS